MLRVVIILLVLANAVYFAWTGGHLAALGLAPTDQTEPQRLRDQVNPDMVRLLNSAQPVAPAASQPPSPPSTPAPETTPPADNAAAAVEPPPSAPEPAVAAPAAPPSLPTACWRATGYSEAQARQLRSALAGVPDLQGLWQIDESRLGGRWVVYMGKLSEETMQRKKAELKALKVDYREVRVPHLSPGLALGTYSTESAAEQGLRDVTRKGVRSARVAQEREETTSHTLTLPAVTAPQREQVQALLGSKALAACE